MFQWKAKASNAVFLDEGVPGKGRTFQCRFLEAGLVKYSFGVCLLTKETINKFINDFVGCPVIIDHKDVTKESAKDDRVGVISEVWFDEYEGWFYCKGIIFDDEAIELINNGYNVSCQYEITEYAENKTNALHNGNPYDKVILNGKPEHLAIVKNPRYENAMIAVNALEIDMEAQNGWITKKTGAYTIDEDGKEHAVVQHIWIEESIQPTEWRKWNTKTLYDFKEGDETKFEFDRTRSKISEENINMIKGTLKDITKAYKFNTIAAINVMGLEEGCLGLCASRSNTSTVTLNPQMFSGKYTQKDYDESVKAGFHPKGTGDMIKSVLVHEIGHSLTVHNKNNEEFWGEISGIRSEYMKNITPKDISNPDFISNYARVNIKEFVAEGFCQGVLSKKQGKYTKKIMETIEKYYGTQTQLKLAINASKKEKEEEENIWIEEFGGGYPINEEAYKKFKKEQEPPKSKVKNNIIEAINEIKETDMFRNLFKKEKKQMEKSELKELFMECLEDLTARNEAVDKRKLIDEIGGILKDKVDDEIIRTIIKKAEELSYNPSEKSKADNEKEEIEEEEKEEKKEVKNKCGKNEEKEEDAENKCGKNEDKKDDEEDKKEAKNAMEEQKNKFYAGNNQSSSSTYLSKSKAIELGDRLF